MAGRLLGWASLVALYVQGATADARWNRRTFRQAAANGTGFPNGDFESGKVAPWSPVSMGSAGDPDNSLLSIASPGDNSKYAAQLSAAPTGGAGWMEVYVPATRGTNYSITLSYKVTQVSGSGCTLTVVGYDGENEDNNQQTVLPMVVGDWNQTSLVYSNFVQSEFSLSIGVSCPNGGNSTVLIDNIGMTTASGLQPGSCSSSPTVANGGFESGSIAPWTVSRGTNSSFSIVSPGDNSAHALQISATAGDMMGFDWWQTVPGVCFGYQYSYSFALNWQNYGPVQPDPRDGCMLSITTYNCGDDDIPVEVAPAASGWQQHTFNCTAKRNDVQMDFGIICGPKLPANAWSLQIDNIDLKLLGGPTTPTPSPSPTPTPSSLAMLRRERAHKPEIPRWF